MRSAAQVGIMGGEGMQVVRWISYAPSNPNIVYLTSDTSQVWKSTDGGASWQMKHNGFLANGGLSLAIHPSDPNIVFVAGAVASTGDATCSMDNGPLVPGCAAGIYRTMDGGESWAMVKQTVYYDLRSSKKIGGAYLAFAGANTIYAGTHKEGLLKSTDGGNTWQTLNILTDRKILDVKTHPQNSSIIFLSADRSSLSDPVLYKLIDNGTLTLEPIGNNLNSLSDANEPIPVARAIAINPINPNIIYVSMGIFGVYKSEDGGVSFAARNSGLPPITWNMPATYLAISPVNPDYLYVDYHVTGTKHPYYTHNGGDSWLQPSYIHSIWRPDTNGGGSVLHNSITPHPTDANIAITTGEGHYPVITGDGGDTWLYSGNGYCGGPATIAATSFSWDPDPYSNRLALFLVDQGPFLTEDGGSTFKILNIPRYAGAMTTPVGALDPTPNGFI